MTPGEAIIAATPGAVASTDFDELTLTIPVSEWVAAAEVTRGLGFDYLDLLTAWETDEGFVAALQLWSMALRQRMRLVCLLPREAPSVQSLTGVFPGVDWHERETAEMFGIDFVGHPNLVPLLLPDPVITAAPLRKDFALPARSARPWPGEIEP